MPNRYIDDWAKQKSIKEVSKMISYYSKAKLLMAQGELDKALEIFQQGLDNGDVKCAYGMVAANAIQELPIDTQVQNLADALPRITELAQAGDAEAHFILGRCYETGTVFDQQLNLAVKHYSIASDKGNSDAMFNLGCVYIQCGLPLEDVVKKYFHPAANLGNVYAVQAMKHYSNASQSSEKCNE